MSMRAEHVVFAMANFCRRRKFNLLLYFDEAMRGLWRTCMIESKTALLLVGVF